MSKQQFITDLKEGDRVHDLFLVKSSRLAETRAGKPYLILGLVDKSGEISGPVWDDAVRIAEFCHAGSFIHLTGQVQSYREKLQLKVEGISPVEKEVVQLGDYVPSSEFDLEDMAIQLERLISTIENSWVRKLLKRFFTKGEHWERFQYAPAAKGIHHAYAGGLIEHCLSMARLADFLAGHYPGIDRSLLLAGVLLHDIGKIRELEEEMGLVEYTSPGRLKGHLVMGSEMAAVEASKIKEFPEELLLQIQHLILSHHGKMEFGSPTVPMTPEAFLLSYIDDMDSKMNLIEQLRKKQNGEEAQWTDYQRSLERFLYLSPLKQEAMEDDEESLESIAKQKTLF